MTAAAPQTFTDPDEIARAIIEKTGSKVILALPLGLGKAVHIANALVKAAVKDSDITLDIFTALTLEPPKGDSELKKRLLEPAKKRLFGDYPEFEYARHLHDGTLPDNITVNEFFLLAGQWLGNAKMQQNYVAANYTHALRYIAERKVNVVAPLVAPPTDGHPDRYSTSCNPDILMDLMKYRDRGDMDFILAGQTNSRLPYMTGEATIESKDFDMLLDGPDTDFELYSAPKRPITYADQAIGLHAARLVRDGGTLQIGIGSIGDAIAKSLIMRHKDNDKFRAAVFGLNCDQTPDLYHDDSFDEGLHGVSEMFVDGFLHLAEAGVLSREVDGALLSGAFFVDCKDFYRKLRDMTPAQRARFRMVPVSFTNELYGDEKAKRAARVKASFINNAMMATLHGAVVSDALEGARVVSGVGGQYNFVAQAFALEDARSIITLNATHDSGGKTRSNIVWSYGHETIPWHLRDIVVTEYGVADLRGRTDEDVIKAMLNIADSRFQDELLDQARRHGKVEKDYRIPDHYHHNTPERLLETLQPLRKDGTLPQFPFGTDFTDEEIRLLPALQYLKNKSASKWNLVKLYWAGLAGDKPTPEQAACLNRMKLSSVSNSKGIIYRPLVLEALRRTQAGLD